MENSALSLPVGTNLQIQATVPENAPRYMVKVVGYIPGLTLIVNTPTVGGKVQIIRPGQRFTVRLLRGNSVVAFIAQVLVSPVKPIPHLFLEFPSDFEQVNVRNSARVNANVAAKVRNTKMPDVPENFSDATIVDLSESGLRLATLAPLGEAGDMLQMNFRLEVLGKTEDLSLVGDIKNVSERITGKTEEDKRTIYYSGVQFKAVNRYQQVLMYSWVMRNIAENKVTPG